MQGEKREMNEEGKSGNPLNPPEVTLARRGGALMAACLFIGISVIRSSNQHSTDA